MIKRSEGISSARHKAAASLAACLAAALCLPALCLPARGLPAQAPQEAAEKAAPPAQESAPAKDAPAGQGKAPDGAAGLGGVPGGGLPAGVLARVNGRDITVEDYTQYLFAALGKSKIREFIDRLLLEEEGKRLEVMPAPEEVEERVASQIDSAVKTIYQNSMERFLESLSRRGVTLEERKQQLRQETAYRLLEDRCILKTRKVSEEDIRARFEQTYGPGGVQYEIRHILISTRPRPGESRPALTDQEARARAEKALKEIQSGADFAQMVRAYSDDDLTKRNDGRIPYYQRGYRGQEFHDAVTRLTEDNRVSGLVKSPYGYHVIQLIDRKTTRLEDKRAEVLRLLENQVPTAHERNQFQEALRQKAKIEM